MLRSKAETARRGAATGFIRSRDLVNDALSFVVTQGSIVVPDIREVVPTAVVCFSHRRGVVSQEDIAVVAIVFWHS